MLLVGSLSSGGALDFHEFALTGGGRSIVTLARDDGRYANSPLKSWFDQLASGKGLCCSFADGFKVDEVAAGAHGAAGGEDVVDQKYPAPGSGSLCHFRRRLGTDNPRRQS